MTYLTRITDGVLHLVDSSDPEAGVLCGDDDTTWDKADGAFMFCGDCVQELFEQMGKDYDVASGGAVVALSTVLAPVGDDHLGHAGRADNGGDVRVRQNLVVVIRRQRVYLNVMAAILLLNAAGAILKWLL